MGAYLSLFTVPQNRWFLVEILYPSSQPVPTSASSSSSNPVVPNTQPSSASSSSNKRSQPTPSSSKKPKRSRSNPQGSSASHLSDSEGEDEDEDSIEWSSLTLGGPMPLLLPPPPNPTTGKGKRLDERSIHQALKASVTQVFGDDGWGKVGTNTSGMPLVPCQPFSITLVLRDSSLIDLDLFSQSSTTRNTHPSASSERQETIIAPSGLRFR